MDTSLLYRALACGLVCLLLGGGSAWGQSDDTSPDEEGVWTFDAVGRLNASQVGYSNWEKGEGSDALSIASTVRGEASKKGTHWIQLHEISLGFGLINQEGQDIRKSDDRIQANTSFRYNRDEGFFSIFNPTIAGNLRTQFAAGFDYEENPFEDEVEEGDPRLDQDFPIQNSSFLAPAYFTESLGLTYEPFADLTMRLGAASKQTVVVDEDVRVLYGVDENKTVRVEGGAEFASTLDTQLTENIRYRSQLNAFFSFNQPEDPPDALWENNISLQVNDWLSTDLELTALFDRDITKNIQLKESISVGVSFNLL